MGQLSSGPAAVGRRCLPLSPACQWPLPQPQRIAKCPATPSVTPWTSPTTSSTLAAAGPSASPGLEKGTCLTLMVQITSASMWRTSLWVEIAQRGGAPVMLPQHVLMVSVLNFWKYPGFHHFSNIIHGLVLEQFIHCI